MPLVTAKSGSVCLICEQRFTRTTGPKYVFKHGHICQKCYKQRRSETIEQAASDTVVQSPVRVTKVQRTQSCPTPSSFTPEQSEKLHNGVKQEIGQRGLVMSEVRRSKIALNMNFLLSPQSPIKGLLSYDGTAKLVAKLDFTTHTAVRQIHRTAAANKSLVPPPVERITISNPLHMSFATDGPSLQVETFLWTHMEDVEENNLYTSLTSIQAAVFAATGEEIPRTTLHRWLHKLGLEYGEKKLTGLSKPYTDTLIRRYCVQYARLLRLEKAGQIVLVWMDESYIHAGYCAAKGWYRANREGGPVKGRTRGTEKGKRIIIMHAMTREGMLDMEVDITPTMSDNLGVKCATAAVVSTTLSPEGGDKEDYHDTLDGPKFVAWVTNRLLVAFEAKYPGQKMCLIMDNAKYHKARGEDWINPASMSRAALANELIYRDIMAITDGETGQTWGAHTFQNECRGDVRYPGPTMQLMKDVLRWYLESHAVNSTLVEQALVKHELLFTPPYESWIQPIELIWAYVKHQVALQSHRLRKYQETAQQTRDALRTVTPELCGKYIARSERKMSEWLATSDAGSLQKRYGSLAAMVAAPHEEVAAAPDTAVENVKEKENIVEEENQEDQLQQKARRKRELRPVVLEMRKGARSSARVRKRVYV